jgi:hypothetical protein
MNVLAKKRPVNWVSKKLLSLGFSNASVLGITEGASYEVHGVVVWCEVVFFQIVSDSGILSWLPSLAFEVIDRSVPNDWLVNQFDDEVQFILGPAFISDSKQDYGDMVELDPEKVRQFRARFAQRSLLQRNFQATDEQ